MSLRGAKQRSHAKGGQNNLKNVIRLPRRLPMQTSRNDVKRIGIFGGSFNPIHIGHLKMAEAARKEYKLSSVYFIPCGIPPHKLNVRTCHGMSLLPAKLRYKLVKEAIKKTKHFKVLDIEIKKKKPAYTVDTVLRLPRRLPMQTPRNDIKLYFLIGADEFEKLQTWKNPNKLAQLLEFLVLPRPSKNIKAPKIKNLKWHMVHTKPVNISSTEIRNRIEKGKSVKNLISYKMDLLLP